MNKPAQTDYPIHELLSTRWSPRAFGSRPIEPDKIHRMFEAARWAPSSYNEQPWAFIVATKEQPEEFAKVLQCLIEFNQGWAKEAPLIFLTVAHLSFDKNGHPNRHAFHDVGLAMGNFSVQATAEGIQVHQMAGVIPEKARELFAIPEGWDIVTGVAAGYPGDLATLSEQLRQREMDAQLASRQVHLSLAEVGEKRSSRSDEKSVNTNTTLYFALTLKFLTESTKNLVLGTIRASHFDELVVEAQDQEGRRPLADEKSVMLAIGQLQ